ncbi:MAG TPA: DNA-3-methyladenine glycosylase [Pirellulales bacterium]|nr:DNA-3-methyladenine glycosylase [Pirellulales bacterium]
MTPLEKDFFARDTLTVARDLIGTVMSVGRCAGRIVETEAYTTDAASHYVTRRNQAIHMRETHGHLYVYFIYGMYYCLNFTTDASAPGAILIRAAEPLRGVERMLERRKTKDVRKLATGPGRLCQAFGIDLSFNGLPIGGKFKVFAREDSPRIATTPRIGISQARDLPWRFYELGNAFVCPHPRSSDQKATARRGRLPG